MHGEIFADQGVTTSEAGFIINRHGGGGSGEKPEE